MFPYDADSVTVTPHLTNNSILQSSIFYLEIMEIYNLSFIQKLWKFIIILQEPLPWVDVENLSSNQCLQCFVRVNAPASQPHFYEHIQESKDVFQEKTYSYQASFFMGICHREKHQVGLHWDNGIDCGYLYQSSPK